MTIDEEHYLSHLVETLGQTEAERTALRELRFQDANAELLFAEVTALGEAEKGYVFDTCLEILASDRRINAQELTFLAALRKVCGIGFWSYHQRLSRGRRRAKAWIFPRRTVAVLGFLLLALFVAAKYAGSRAREATVSLGERCTGRDVSVSLFSPADQPNLPSRTGADIFAEVCDSIVSVDVLMDNDPICGGSGSVIGTDESGVLYIVTNRHVIDGCYPAIDQGGSGLRIEVRQYSGARFDARLDFYSRTHDLALLAVNGMQEYAKPLPLNLRSGLQVGQHVYAIGSPLGLDHTFTAGVISAFRESYLQTDATVYSGSSGGPLIDGHGTLCAVVTRVHQTKDYGFALYSDLILDLLNERRGYLSQASGTPSP